MILHLTDRKGNNTLLIDTINHKRLLDKLNRTSEELEKKGVYLIKEGGGCYEFASTKNGWECVLIVATNYVRKIK